MGEVVGFGLVAALAALVFGQGQPTTPVTALFALAAGVLEGSCLALAQGFPLRERFPAITRRAWLLATVPGACAAYVLGFLGFPALGDSGLALPLKVALFALLGLAMALLLAGPQWLVLRRHAGRAGAWIPASVVAWALAVAAAIAIVSFLPADPGFAVVALHGAAAGVAMGLIVGVVTGWAFARLAPRASSTRAAVARP